jgi:ketosteroid isomerase-like protein
MSVEENVRLVKEGYAAFGAGDLPKLLGLMSPDIVWEFPASTVIPFAGKFVGPTETARFFGAIAEHVEAEAFEPLHFVASGDRVVVLGHERFRVKSTGRTWQCEWSHAFALGAGKITNFREYTDTAVIEAAFRAV